MAAKHTPAAAFFDRGAVKALFDRDDVRTRRWGAMYGAVFLRHSHDYDKVLYCLEGSITFEISPSDEVFELHAGDRLDIDAGTEHRAVVGSAGVLCAEAEVYQST